MLKEVIAHLQPQNRGIYLDGTFGRGGYTSALLDRYNCQVIALDRDAQAINWGKTWGEKYGSRLMLHNICFSKTEDLLRQNGLTTVDGIVLDLGVSSPQLDDAQRGFSFQQEGPLHMGMGLNKQTAADVVNTFDARALREILWTYGEEKRAGAIARALVAQRRIKLFETTTQLAACVRQVVHNPKKDAATRTFQALRIYINQELEELETFLKICHRVLAPGGRLVIVCFHSLEERIVKKFFQQYQQNPPRASRHHPPNPSSEQPVFFSSKKALRPQEDEIQRNPRARSARLRWGVRAPL